MKYSDGTYHRLGIEPGASEVRIGRDPATGEIVTRQVKHGTDKTRTCCKNFL